MGILSFLWKLIIGKAVTMAGEVHKPYKLSIVPKTFSGHKDQDPEEFIEQYIQASESNFWNDDIQTKQFINFLHGTPAKWFRCFLAKRQRDAENEDKDEPDPLTWTELKTGFLDAFVSLARDIVDGVKLDQRRQKPQKSVEDYFYSILALCDKVDPDMGDQRRVRKLLKGLLPSFLDKILPLAPENPEELLKNLRSVAETKVITGRNDELTVFSIATEPILTQLKQIQENTESLARKVDQVQAENKDQIDTLSKRIERIALSRGSTERVLRLAPVRCFNCNSAGHVSTQCRLPRRAPAQVAQNIRDREMVRVNTSNSNQVETFRGTVPPRFQPRFPISKNGLKRTAGSRPIFNAQHEQPKK